VILGVKPGVVTDAMLTPIQQVRMPLMNNPTPPVADTGTVKQAVASATHN
jgi:hypothetical protein